MTIRNVIRIRFIIVVNIRYGLMALVLYRSRLCPDLVDLRLLLGVRFLVTLRCLIFIRGRLMGWHVNLDGRLMIGSDLMYFVLKLVNRLLSSYAPWKSWKTWKNWEIVLM